MSRSMPKSCVALLDRRAVRVINRSEKALHARYEIDGGERRGVSGEFEIFGDRPLQRLGHLHLRRRRRNVGVLRAIAGRERDRAYPKGGRTNGQPEQERGGRVDMRRESWKRANNTDERARWPPRAAYDA